MTFDNRVVRLRVLVFLAIGKTFPDIRFRRVRIKVVPIDRAEWPGVHVSWEFPTGVGRGVCIASTRIPPDRFQQVESLEVEAGWVATALLNRRENMLAKLERGKDGFDRA